MGIRVSEHTRKRRKRKNEKKKKVYEDVWKIDIGIVICLHAPFTEIKHKVGIIYATKSVNNLCNHTTNVAAIWMTWQQHAHRMLPTHRLPVGEVSTLGHAKMMPKSTIVWEVNIAPAWIIINEAQHKQDEQEEQDVVWVTCMWCNVNWPDSLAITDCNHFQDPNRWYSSTVQAGHL